jgi:hypothetical protein
MKRLEAINMTHACLDKSPTEAEQASLPSNKGRQAKRKPTFRDCFEMKS